MVLALLFGLAPNYYLAICIRTLWGFTNGNLGVLKTYVSEMCSEDKQSLGFSLIVTMGGISKYVFNFYFIVALLVPVWVDSQEMQKHISLHQSNHSPNYEKFFIITLNYFQLPLFLPASVGSMMSVIVLLIVIFMFPESLTKEMRINNKKEKEKSHGRYLEIKKIMKTNKDYVPSIDDRYIIQLNEGGYYHLIRNRDVFWSCLIYGFYALIQSGQDALYPVWLILDPEHNGFSFTSSDLGWLYTGLSPIQIFSTPLIFPLIGRLMNTKKVSFMSGFIYAFLLCIGPFAALANTASVPVIVNHLIHSQVQWVTILLTYGTAQCFRFFFVTNGMVFITNSTFQDFRAKVNALGQVFSATFRFIVSIVIFYNVQGPSVASNTFAWAIGHDYPFPFNYALPFYVTFLEV